MLNSKEGVHNRAIVKNQTLNLLDTNWIIKDDKIVKNNSNYFKRRNLDSIQKIFPEFKILLKYYKKVITRFGIK